MLKLPYCIAIAGLVCALFAFGIPQLSSLRIWLGFSTFFSLIYLVAVSVLSLKDGIAHSIISFFFSLSSSKYFLDTNNTRSVISFKLEHCRLKQ